MTSRAAGIVIALLLAAPSARAEEEAPWGRSEYLRYCSACHGEDADGDGPVANVLQPRPPALTSLHAKYGNPLSTRFIEYVNGTTMPRAHGTSDMPVWGRVLGERAGEDREGAELLWKIARYLDRIQVKGEGSAP